MVGVTISNEVNEQDKPIGISFRRKDQLSEEVIWSMFEKVAQSNARFNALDRLIVVVHTVKMPVGFGRTAQRRKGRTVANLAHLKRSVIEVKAENNCLAHALIVTIARLEKDPNYQSYRKGNKIRPVVARLLEATGIDQTNGGGIPELVSFQEHFGDYKIVVYDGLHCDNIMLQGQTGSSKRINLLFADVSRHYHVITNLKGAMA
jgi:hypothetical protein